MERTVRTSNPEIPKVEIVDPLTLAYGQSLDPFQGPRRKSRKAAHPRSPDWRDRKRAAKYRQNQARRRQRV